MRKLPFRVVLLAALVISVLSLSVVVSAQDDVFRVAAVAPSAENDLAFSQSMFDALTMIDEAMGDAFEFTFQEGTFVVDDAAAALRDWASSGEYDLVVAHGSQFGSVVEELASEFPEVSFAWGTDVNTFGLPNVYAYSPAAEQGGYINGALAAMLSEAGNIGVIGPIEVGDAKLYVDGFTAGALSVNPDIAVNVTYIQSFSDVPLATEAAAAFVANGADVLTGTAQMVVGPIAIATENGLYWFGTQSSQAELAAESGVLFQVYRFDVVLEEIIASVKEGVLGGTSFTLTLENGGLDMQPGAMLDEETAAMVQETVDTLSEGIISGEIVVLPPEPEATPAS
jgi:basic membrane protein A